MSQWDSVVGRQSASVGSRYSASKDHKQEVYEWSNGEVEAMKETKKKSQP